MDFHDAETFRAQDLNWLNSEERICWASEHRYTSPCTEKALPSLPKKQQKETAIYLLYLMPFLVHLRGVPMQPADSHPFSGPCASRLLMYYLLCKGNIY